MFLLISQRLSATTVIEKGILLENVDLEEIKGEDLIVTMAGAMHQQLNLHHRHWGFRKLTTAGIRAVVNTGKGKLNTDLKKSRWVWRPKGNYLDHVSKDSGSFMLKKGTPEICLQDPAVWISARKNRTLIEAARTMLADSFLPIPFWAEAVNTACYVLNRILVTKPQNKTPYELLIGKSPSFSCMRPFGCPLTILNTLDSLGKVDGKFDEGYLLRYSTFSKAFRVYNKRTKRVEENLHINFLEYQPNVAGTGPNWMFDLDFLTNSMNYILSVRKSSYVDAGDFVPLMPAMLVGAAVDQEIALKRKSKKVIMSASEGEEPEDQGRIYMILMMIL
ncbi:retrovirus-related pol polyprotein from transposon TNT 1-94 [Tanacetum coccineum]